MAKYLIFVIILAALAVLVAGCKKSPAPSIGLKNGRLLPCPSSPNCVTSQDGDREHHIDPIPYRGDRASAYAEMKKIIKAQENAVIITDTGEYLHAEFRTKIMRFVDDVEFWFPKDEPVIHIRSASRVGYSDLGVNRKRMERIRALFESSHAGGQAT